MTDAEINAERNRLKKRSVRWRPLIIGIIGVLAIVAMGFGAINYVNRNEDNKRSAAELTHAAETNAQAARTQAKIATEIAQQTQHDAATATEFEQLRQSVCNLVYEYAGPGTTVTNASVIQAWRNTGSAAVVHCPDGIKP